MLVIYLHAAEQVFFLSELIGHDDLCTDLG
jgi:hypothetical protein